jgi:hypothetical protein
MADSKITADQRVDVNASGVFPASKFPGNVREVLDYAEKHGYAYVAEADGRVVMYTSIPTVDLPPLDC